MAKHAGGKTEGILLYSLYQHYPDEAVTGSESDLIAAFSQRSDAVYLAGHLRKAFNGLRFTIINTKTGQEL